MCAWCARRCVRLCVGDCARVCACVFSIVTVTVLNKGVVFKRESTTKCISSICFRLEAAVHMLQASKSATPCFKTNILTHILT